MSAQDRYRRHRLRIIDYLLAALLFAAYLSLLLVTMQMGFTRDEGYYFHSGSQYYGWFSEYEENRAAGHPEDSFTQANIDRHWGVNPEHPVLLKTLFGLSWHAFSQENDWMSPSTAMRFPTAVFSSLLIALVFLFTVEAFGSRAAGLFAVVALGFQPRFFFHAHLACFDAAMTAVWFLVVYAYWKSYHSRLWGWLTGLFFGIALITKLNAFFIPVVLLLHWVLAGARRFGLEGRGWRRRIVLPKIPLAFATMAFLGPLVFYLGWPRHWFDSFNRITWYLGRHLQHEHYYVYYFGKALIRPPFPVSYPFVMTLVTVPIVILLAAFTGTGVMGSDWLAGRKPGSTRNHGRDPRATGLLVAINLLFPIGLIAMPDTPIFGGTKHWMEAMPYLAMFAGVGALWAFTHLFDKTRWAKRRLVRAAALGLFMSILAVPNIHATLYAHPYGTAYYNELVGGIRGAADLEMMRQFWGYSTRSGLSYLNQVAPERTRLFPHNANPDAMHWYHQDGLIRSDIRNVWDPGQADFSFFNHQKAFLPVSQDIWRAVENQAPLNVWTLNGVPMLSLYGDQAAQRAFEPPSDTEPE